MRTALLIALSWLSMVLACWLAGCSAVTPAANKSARHGIARITYYGKHEDKWGDRIACSQHDRAKVGQTIASESSYPCGTRVYVPQLANIVGGSGLFTVQDRGSAIQLRKASHGKCPVFDIYAGTRRQMRKWAAVTPEYLEYEIP